MAKRPSFQFYPGDWLQDLALRMCSLEARGLWIDMICMMHQGEPYGHLTLNGRPITEAMLAKLVGSSTRRVKTLLNELTLAKVCSKNAENVIFSRRMIRDEELRAKRAAGGHLGGNPALMKDNPKVTGKVNLAPTPSSSSSSSPSVTKREGAKTTPPPPSKKNSRFIPPTVEEVAAHILEKGYNFDAETFVAFYESKGWMVGKSKMKSWKAACVTWSKRDYREGKPTKKTSDDYSWMPDTWENEGGSDE